MVAIAAVMEMCESSRSASESKRRSDITPRGQLLNFSWHMKRVTSPNRSANTAWPCHCASLLVTGKLRVVASNATKNLGHDGNGQAVFWRQRRGIHIRQGRKSTRLSGDRIEQVHRSLQVSGRNESAKKRSVSSRVWPDFCGHHLLDDRDRPWEVVMHNTSMHKVVVDVYVQLNVV